MAALYGQVNKQTKELRVALIPFLWVRSRAISARPCMELGGRPAVFCARERLVKRSGLSRHSANLCAVEINSMQDVSKSNQETTRQKAPHPHPSKEYSSHQTRVQRDFVQPLSSSDRYDIPCHKMLLPKYFSCLVVFVACCAYRIPHTNLKILLVKQIHLEN